MRNGFDNDAAWRNSLDSIFSAVRIRDCTPETVFETMGNMKRYTNRLEDITIACRSRNIGASDEQVLECLRQLYKDGKIKHRNVGERDFFIFPNPNL